MFSKSLRNYIYLFIGLFNYSIILPAQNVNTAYTIARPSTSATPIDKPPIIDGEILTDPIWNTITPFESFTQTQPNAGFPTTEKTVVRIAYDQHYFFLSAICHDSEPQSINISDSKRDGALDNTDAFLFILDTYKDGQNGFVFGTNAAGIEYDAQVDNEGQGNVNANRQVGGRIGGVNINWDASWTVRTSRGDYGWSAEFAIPLRTLRYLSGKDQKWGVNFQRNIQRKFEVAYWSPIPVEFNLHRLSLAGTLTGLNLKSPGNLKIIPYVLGNATSNNLVSPKSNSSNAKVGGDIKYSVTPSLTLDLTYNTDFAQVEVDDQQVNIDRFNLFFPEKRPFFLENAGWFGVGSVGEVDLFFSRRIGLSNDGRQIPLVGGARLSGKVNQTNIGLMSLFTDEVSELNVAKNNFSIARINHQFKKRSYIGGVFINKEALGENQTHFNRTYALDGRLGLGNKAQFFAYAAGTSSPGDRKAEHSYKMQYTYEWNKLNITAGYSELGSGFNPEVGFLIRNSFRKPEATILYHWRMNGKFGLLELRPHISYRSYWNYDNHKLETSFLHIDNHWEWINGTEIHTGINLTTEGVFKPFEISKGVTVPAGTYNHSEGQFVVMTNPSKIFAVNIRTIIGGFFGGNRTSTTASLTYRYGEKFNSEWGINNNIVSLPKGDFNTTIFRSRLAYNFTPRLYLQSLIQFNNVVDKWSFNVRLGWLQASNTGLFLVYNENRGLYQYDNRSITVKYSRMIDAIK